VRSLLRRRIDGRRSMSDCSDAALRRAISAARRNSPSDGLGRLDEVSPRGGIDSGHRGDLTGLGGGEVTLGAVPRQGQATTLLLSQSRECRSTPRPARWSQRRATRPGCGARTSMHARLGTTTGTNASPAAARRSTLEKYPTADVAASRVMCSGSSART
jgi:hypothetical protein